MNLTCAKCSHTWDAQPKDGQRLILCPSCNQLTPVKAPEQQPAAVASSEGLTGNYEFGQLLAVPFNVESKQEKKDPDATALMTPSRKGRVGRLALLEGDIANIKDIKETLGEERTGEIWMIVGRVIRYQINQAGGIEIQSNGRFTVAFERPIDAVTFALQLQETMRHVGTELGVDLYPRMAAHVGEFGVSESLPEEVAKGAPPVKVEGEGSNIPSVLRRLAVGRQIVLTRQAYDQARAKAARNPNIPAGTQWVRHGTYRMEEIGGKIEICEVGRPGFAPLQSPVELRKQGFTSVKLPGAGSPQAKGGFLRAVQMGAAELAGTFAHEEVGGGSGVIQLDGLYTKGDHRGQRPEEEFAGKVFSSYLLEKRVAADHDTVSYNARDRHMERDVLIKLLRPLAMQDPERLTRFAREGLSARWLDHPNIVDCHEVGEANGFQYHCYERVHGGSLQSIVEASGPLHLRTAVSYALQVARGLARAHEVGIVHRNIRPADLMASSQGNVKIVSWKYAKFGRETQAESRQMSNDDRMIVNAAMENVTSIGSSLGDPEYISPEQARDASTVDSRTDQYALGCTLYYLLTGVPPYTGTSSLEIQSKHQYEYKPIEKWIDDPPHTLTHALNKLLAKDPNERFESMDKVVAALENVMGIRHKREEEEDENKVWGDGKMPKSAPDPASLSQEHRVFGKSQEAFYRAPWRGLRAIVKPLCFLLPIVAMLAIFATGAKIGPASTFQLALTPIGLLVFGFLWNVVLDGLINKSPLFLYVRRAMLRQNPMGWVLTIAGVLVAIIFLYYLGLLIYWAIVAVLGLGIALVYQLALVVPLRMQRAESINEAREQIRTLRSLGFAEEGIQEGVFNACGKHWEEFFEALFDYDRMIEARHKFVSRRKGIKRKRYAAWRDRLIQSCKQIDEMRQLAGSKKTLSEVTGKPKSKDDVEVDPIALHQAQKAAEERRAEEERRQKEIEKAQAVYEAREPGSGFFTGAAAPPSPGKAGSALAGRAAGGGGASVPIDPEEFAAKFGKPLKPYEHDQGGDGLRTMLNIASVAGGATVLVAFLAQFAQGMLPENLGEQLAAYYDWGSGESFLSLFAAAVMLKNAGTKQYYTSVFSIIGGGLLVATAPIVESVNQPQFDAGIASTAGIVLLVLGIGLGGFRKLLSPKSWPV